MSSPSNVALTSQFIDGLPGDPDKTNVRRQVSNAMFSLVDPAAVSEPKILGWTSELATDLGFESEHAENKQLAEICTGQRLLPGSKPYAMRYGGHQFGNWAGQLGDGRAINLGERIDESGLPQTLQLKGAGPTPYSRRGDGLAVLRSSVREFLASEAMHHLGVPTTRALSLALTGDSVMRDILYDGNPALEPGAIVCRVAPSFLRFGNFEILAANGEIEELTVLANYVIRHHFDHLDDAENPTPETYLQMFKEISHTTSEMIVNWMRVGFVHGVMNTDNMSIHGVTIDYGPYGWLDDFDPNWTPNTTDAARRRYRYGNQPAVGQWNLLQLANSLVPLVDDTAELETELDAYGKRYAESHRAMMLTKLGVIASKDGETDTITENDSQLVGTLEDVLSRIEIDMTIFFRRLSTISAGTTDPLSAVQEALYDPSAVVGEIKDEFQGWLVTYQQRLKSQNPAGDETLDESRVTTMNATNPQYVARNYLAYEAIDKATAGDYGALEELAAALREPYTNRPEFGHLAAKRPDWARDKPGCSTLSCSS